MHLSVCFIHKDLWCVELFADDLDHENMVFQCDLFDKSAFDAVMNNLEFQGHVVRFDDGHCLFSVNVVDLCADLSFVCNILGVNSHVFYDNLLNFDSKFDVSEKRIADENEKKKEKDLDLKYIYDMIKKINEKWI